MLIRRSATTISVEIHIILAWGNRRLRTKSPRIVANSKQTPAATSATSHR